MAMRGLVLVCLVAVLANGCNTRQRVAGGGVALAVVGVTLTYSNDVRSEEEVGTKGKIGIACLLTGLVVLFVAAALEESATASKPKEIKVATQADLDRTEQRTATAAQKKRDQAWLLTKQAQEAARTGDCAKVTELSAQVGALDPAFYGEVFMKDLAVQRCFVPAEPSTPAPAVPAVPPVPSVTPPPVPPATPPATP